MKLAYEGQGASADRGLLPDGRRLWVLSQSQLKQIDVCPERGRLTLLGEMPRYSTDSTALGHAVHEAIEACLTDVIDGFGPWALRDMIDVAIMSFEEEMADPTSRWVKVKTSPTIHAQLGRCLTTWYELVLPTLDPFAVEVNFGPLTIHEDESRVIQVLGQIDYVDAQTGLADWKTTGREWIEWEHKRWDVQPTLYTAAFYAYWGDPLAKLPPPISDDFEFPAPWTWHVLNVDGSYQRIETTRSFADWDWLTDRCLVVAKQLEGQLEHWPLNDTSALCSPKYCGAWDTCKGAHFGPNWP